MDNKIKHLEMIQGIVDRMASNSFMLKGWCVTLIVAIIAISIKESNIRLYFITLIPLLAFWVLDSYYLYQEKLFRRLYDDIRKKDENAIDFSMNTEKFKKEESLRYVIFHNCTTFGFYGPFIIIIILFVLIA